MVAGISQRSDHGNPVSGSKRGWARSSFLSSTHDSATRLSANAIALGYRNVPFRFGPLRRIGAVEKPEAELQSQHPTDGIVEPFDSHLSRFHERFEVIPITIVRHVHLHPGKKSKPCRLTAPRSPALIDLLQEYPSPKPRNRRVSSVF